MKKLMKAIAFATVMCMLLSTAAFAAPVANRTDDYVLDVTVATGAAAAEQVALLIVAKDANLDSLSNEQILYVDQTASVESNGSYAASFDVTIDSTKNVKVVDVYAGYASANGPATVLEDVELEEAKALSISLTDTQIIDNVEAWVATLGEEQKAALKDIQIPENNVAAAVITTVNFANFADTDRVTDMFWVFEVAADNNKRYLRGDVNALGINGVCTGAVQMGVSFINGSKNNPERPVLDITGASVIFQINNETDTAKALTPTSGN